MKDFHFVPGISMLGIFRIYHILILSRAMNWIATLTSIKIVHRKQALIDTYEQSGNVAFCAQLLLFISYISTSELFPIATTRFFILPSPPWW